MGIDGTDPFAAKPDPRLSRCCSGRALADGEGVPFAALAHREGVAAPVSCGSSASANLAPDITKAILDGRQPGDLTAEKLLEHSRLPLAWH